MALALLTTRCDHSVCVCVCAAGLLPQRCRLGPNLHPISYKDAQSQLGGYSWTYRGPGGVLSIAETLVKNGTGGGSCTGGGNCTGGGSTSQPLLGFLGDETPSPLGGISSGDIDPASYYCVHSVLLQ